MRLSYLVIPWRYLVITHLDKVFLIKFIFSTYILMDCSVFSAKQTIKQCWHFYNGHKWMTKRGILEHKQDRWTQCLNVNDFGTELLYNKAKTPTETGEFTGDLDSSVGTPSFRLANFKGLSNLWQNCAIVTVSKCDASYFCWLYVPILCTQWVKMSKCFQCTWIDFLMWAVKIAPIFSGFAFWCKIILKKAKVCIFSHHIGPNTGQLAY